MTETSDIYFKPSNIKGKIQKGTTVFEAAEILGIHLRSECGKKGTCGKCRIAVNIPENLSPLTKTEKKNLSASQLKSLHRLACQAKISDSVTLTIPEDLILKNDTFGKTGMKGSFPVNPAIKRIFISKGTIKKINTNHSHSLEDIITKAVHKEHHKTIRFISRYSFKDLSKNIHTSGTTLVHHDINGVTSIQKGIKKTSLGIGFDIGTTTIAAYLCDMNSGSILTSSAIVNPQKQFGEDVISRIAAISEEEKHLMTQQKLVAESMDDLIIACLKATGSTITEIDEITVVGNTTMEHILGCLNPRSIGIYPYLPVTRSSILTCALDLGLNLLPATPVYIFPVISGFLGGDILSAVLADQSYKKKETTLMIDIGTNGELMLCSSKKMWATSCATGPALEGAQISNGMRASSGAINKVYTNPKNNKQILFETIGNVKPKGICGSGIIDALAAMRKTGIILKNGTFNTEHPDVICNEKNIGRNFKLPGSNIRITLKDIRQVQLAKAALYVGIETLLKHAGITKVDKTILTGAFGSTFNWQNARDIGMLPGEICEKKIESALNLAGTGSVIALLDKKKRTEIESISKKINYIDLADEPDFTEQFSKATQFPVIK